MEGGSEGGADAIQQENVGDGMMKQMTEQNLINAFGGESMAHMRYLHFANQGEKEGYARVARLFRAIAHAEYIHAGDHYRELPHLNGGFVANSMGAFGPGDSLKNLGLAIAGETYEIEEMYPTYMKVAEFQDERGAYRSFRWSYETEKMHKALFEKAKKAVENHQDVELGAIQVCSVCGYTLEGEAPEKCPVCGAGKEQFTPFA
jgi:rubrerythrin